MVSKAPAENGGREVPIKIGNFQTAYSLTPPRATPAMMYLLRAKFTIISGSAVMVRPS